MHSAVALLLALVAASAIARPPANNPKHTAQTPLQAPPHSPPPAQPLKPPQLPHEIITEYDLYRMFVPSYLTYETDPRGQADDWLDKEIDRINRMEKDDDIPYEKDLAKIIDQDPFLSNMLKSQTTTKRHKHHFRQLSDPEPLQNPLTPSALTAPDDRQKKHYTNNSDKLKSKAEANKKFALTPLDVGYFDTVSKSTDYPVTKYVRGYHEGGGKIASGEMNLQRKIRQNPLSKTKTLVAENLDRLRAGLKHDEYGSTEKPHSIRLLEAATPDPNDSIYGLAIIAAVATSIVLAMIGFAFGWYMLSKRAKAAADVDYPAYGVTGPTVDMSGDRKLAHSAHMYHYQHQKQQIIAMERNGMEQRNGSVSDPESEEENEEGDYTVYECPGFATTGDMEVKNPLFTEEPTPATPGKCELVKPQPKE